MNDPATHLPPYAPTGQPVRRFVVAQVMVAVLFGALWWSGLVAPRLSQGDKSSGSYNRVSGRATAEFDLRNRSLVAVDVLGVTLGGGQVKVASARVNGSDIATAGQRVAGGGAAKVELEFTFTCRPTPGNGRLPSPGYDRIKLEVTVRTPIGLERTRDAGTVSLPPSCRG